MWVGECVSVGVDAASRALREGRLWGRGSKRGQSVKYLGQRLEGQLGRFRISRAGGLGGHAGLVAQGRLDGMVAERLLNRSDVVARKESPKRV